MSPAKVMIKLTMLHFVEQTRTSLLPILSVLNVKILKSGISKNAGHLISIVRVLVDPTLTKRRLNAWKTKNDHAFQILGFEKRILPASVEVPNWYPSRLTNKVDCLCLMGGEILAQAQMLAIMLWTLMLIRCKKTRGQTQLVDTLQGGLVFWPICLAHSWGIEPNQGTQTEQRIWIRPGKGWHQYYSH